jgi:hypothetical protein
MVLLEVNAQRVTLPEFKRDAPRAIDVNGVAKGSASQQMKIEAWNPHIFGMACAIQRIQPA